VYEPKIASTGADPDSSVPSNAIPAVATRPDVSLAGYRFDWN